MSGVDGMSTPARLMSNVINAEHSLWHTRQEIANVANELAEKDNKIKSLLKKVADLEAELLRKEQVLTWVGENQDVPSHVKRALGREMLRSFMCNPTRDSSKEEAGVPAALSDD